MMARRFTCLCALAAFSLVCSVLAQEQKPKEQSPAQVDNFEKAHQGLFAPKGDKAAEVSRKTADFATATSPKSIPGEVPRKSLIDEHIFGRMERDGIPHAGLATDEEFVRRAYLDATGLLPAADAVRRFAAEKDPQKRDKLIDSLIASDEFPEQWAWHWMDLFQSRYSASSSHTIALI